MSRNIALDILKLSMAFMVVGLHAKLLADFSALGAYLTVNGLFRIAVPVFFIINGFYFFSTVAKNGQREWLKRVFALYVVWMLFYSYAWFSIPPLSVQGLVTFLHKIVFGYSHLWYVPGLIGAALILLLMRKLSSLMLGLTVAVTFLSGVFIQYVGNYHLFQGTVLDTLFNYHWFHRNLLFFAYPFFCLGYLINRESLHERLKLSWLIPLSLLGLLALIGESYFNFYQEGRDGGFDNFLSLMLFGPALFLLFMNINVAGSTKRIALYASSVYFVHVSILNGLRGATELNETMLTLVVIVASLIASFFVIKLNDRFRYIL